LTDTKQPRFEGSSGIETSTPRKILTATYQHSRSNTEQPGEDGDTAW
jgi:hypothetical protein